MQCPSKDPLPGLISLSTQGGGNPAALCHLLASPET